MLRPANPWLRMLIAMGCLAVLLGSILLVTGRANAQFPPSGDSFVHHFKAGDYGHFGKHTAYSTTFKRLYLHKYMRQYDKHYGAAAARLSVTQRASIRVRQWNQFTDTDTCDSADYHLINTPNCHWGTKAYDRALYGNYLTRNDAIWTLRILWCGAVGVATFYSGGGAAAAIGPGAAGCLGTFLIP